MGKTIGRVHSHETFGLVDGPGVRYVVFLQGCHMRCQFCHNPETWALEGGQEFTADDLFKKVLRYRPYWKDNGGITVSGGEPLLQIDFLIDFFTLAHEQGIHTTLDTSGQPFNLENKEWMEKFDQLMAVTDLFMLDIKEMNEEKHKSLTKWSNSNIIAMAKYLSDHDKAMWIRHVLVPGLTDDKEGLEDLYKLISELKTVERTEILPYHTLGLFKWENLGIEYPLDGVRTPSAEEVKTAEDILHIVK